MQYDRRRVIVTNCMDCGVVRHVRKSWVESGKYDPKVYRCKSCATQAYWERKRRQDLSGEDVK